MSQPFSARCPVGRGCTRALFETCDSCEFVPPCGTRGWQFSAIDRSPTNPTFSTQVPAITNSNHLIPGAPVAPLTHPNTFSLQKNTFEPSAHALRIAERPLHNRRVSPVAQTRESTKKHIGLAPLLWTLPPSKSVNFTH